VVGLRRTVLNILAASLSLGLAWIIVGADLGSLAADLKTVQATLELCSRERDRPPFDPR